MCVKLFLLKDVTITNVTIREAIQKKNLLLFGFFQFRLDPPSVFWNPLRNFFLNLIFFKFLNMFGF